MMVYNNGRARYFRSSQLVVPAILSEASAEDTHPPPRRGLGGGSGLQLPAEQAGVEVVSRGIGVFTLLNLHYNFLTKCIRSVAMPKRVISSADRKSVARISSTMKPALLSLSA